MFHLHPGVDLHEIIVPVPVNEELDGPGVHIMGGLGRRHRGGADFVKTSTGFGPEGATVEDVELLRDELSEDLGVKASGGILTSDDAEAMINAGAARLGTSHAVEIISGFDAFH